MTKPSPTGAMSKAGERSGPKTAMVLAAGLGRRMRPLTDERPKPLIEVAGKALVDYALDRFAAAGVEKAVVNVHYFADMMETHVLTRDDLDIVISDEREMLLETGGGLKKARNAFDEDAIFCTNTDAILIDGQGAEACARLSDAWRPDEMDMLLLLTPIEQTTGYDGAGDFDRSADGRIAFRTGKTAPLVFTGLQIIKPSLLDDAPDGAFSTKLLWDKALEKGRLFGAVHDGAWMHVGDPQGLEIAQARLSGAAPLNPAAANASPQRAAR